MRIDEREREDDIWDDKFRAEASRLFVMRGGIYIYVMANKRYLPRDSISEGVVIKKLS